MGEGCDKTGRSGSETALIAVPMTRLMVSCLVHHPYSSTARLSEHYRSCNDKELLYAEWSHQPCRTASLRTTGRPTMTQAGLRPVEDHARDRDKVASKNSSAGSAGLVFLLSQVLNTSSGSHRSLGSAFFAILRTTF